MKKTFMTMSALLLLSATLAACNTDTNEPAPTTATNEEQQQNEQTETQENNTEQNSVTNTDEQQEQQEQQQNTESEESKTEEPTSENPTLTYTSNGKSYTEDVTTSKSTEMDYSITHLQNYKLVAEEPGKDSLLYKADDNFSMQIEVFNKEETTFDTLKQSVNETMTAISSQYTELDLAKIANDRADILNIIGYETIFEETDKVFKIAFEREDKFVILTIYDNVAADLYDAFLQMGLTIK